MSSDIVFSIVVPVYNNENDIRNCLKSLINLDYDRKKYEIIIVDNKSTDKTPEIIRSFDVKYLIESEIQSSYAARNTGLREAEGRFVAFTDSDCQVDSHWLSRIEDAAGDEGIGCLAGEILSATPETTIERFSDSIGLLRQRGPLSGWHFKPYAQTANAVYRRDVFDRVGMFDHSMQSGGDAEIAWRMLDQTDYRLEFVPDALVYHHHRTSLPDLWSQFRRYGGGKMSWALAQDDFTPPTPEKLETDIVKLLSEALEKLEENGADEEALIFPFLRGVTQAAHLTGYHRDLLRLLTHGAKGDETCKAALKAAPRCGLCGGRSFLAKDGDSICYDCGSQADDRILGRALRSIGAEQLASSSVIVIGDFPKETVARDCMSFRARPLDTPGGGDQADFVLVKGGSQFTDAGGLETLDRLVSPLRQTGALILCADVEPAEAPGFDARLAEALPNASIRSSWTTDQASGMARLIAVAAANPEASARLVLNL